MMRTKNDNSKSSYETQTTTTNTTLCSFSRDAARAWSARLSSSPSFVPVVLHELLLQRLNGGTVLLTQRRCHIVRRRQFLHRLVAALLLGQQQTQSRVAIVGLLLQLLHLCSLHIEPLLLCMREQREKEEKAGREEEKKKNDTCANRCVSSSKFDFRVSSLSIASPHWCDCCCV